MLRGAPRASPKGWRGAACPGLAARRSSARLLGAERWASLSSLQADHADLTKQRVNQSHGDLAGCGAGQCGAAASGREKGGAPGGIRTRDSGSSGLDAARKHIPGWKLAKFFVRVAELKFGGSDTTKRLGPKSNATLPARAAGGVAASAAAEKSFVFPFGRAPSTKLGARIRAGSVRGGRKTRARRVTAAGVNPRVNRVNRVNQARPG